MVQELKAQGQWPPALELQSSKAVATWMLLESHRSGEIISLKASPNHQGGRAKFPKVP